ncbi:NADP-dependent oxidoreductase [Streptomyces sp. RFCAC02]|uniref:NADP-dependent oxidoreductase n=1 Tax=Streptomyces sp. RFCAC02 TaxID=2499143 RepID=UPI00101F4AB3|nr:NADP-dependent oxidoreductase [Streptomyces sp. RFCAC02]
MSRAVRFGEYGGVDVLHVDDVERPEPGPGQVLVQVRAAGINPGEAGIREGRLHSLWPATFPSGQGSDLAGVVTDRAPDVADYGPGDEVIGFTDDRASQAEYVAVDARNLTARPAGVPWEVAGALFVAGTTAYACVRAVKVTRGDLVVVAGAAGGVGTLAAQLARNAGATVVGLAGPAHHDWLGEHGIVPVVHGEGVADRLLATAGRAPDAFIDTHGGGYVRLAIELGVRADRINTTIDFEDARRYGTSAEGSSAAADARVLAELAAQLDTGDLDLPIARAYPLEEVRDAYRDLAGGHTLGKIVLIP